MFKTEIPSIPTPEPYDALVLDVKCLCDDDKQKCREAHKLWHRKLGQEGSFDWKSGIKGLCEGPTYVFEEYG
jgi:hypothetical protein